MEAVHTILLLVSAAAILTTLLPFLKWNHWVVRVFDFPRLQIAAIQLALLVVSAFFMEPEFHWWYVITMLLLGSFGYQLKKIFSFTPLAGVEVKKYQGQQDDNSLSLMVSNVLISNKKPEALINLVRQRNPDILLTLETDQWWEDELKEIEKDYPTQVKVPLDNKYGMHLYSKLELQNPQVKYLLSDEVPSIHASLKLRSGHPVEIHCLHPKPPSPTESETSAGRDAELLIVAKEVQDLDKSVLVFGDLNDVAWSHTTRLFKKVSELLDPRVGRGFYNTFNAKYPLFRWPLDHIFHSNDFLLREIQRLANIGSDHFPMYVSLQYHPQAEHHQDEPEADRDEMKQAEKKINEGRTEQPD